MLVISVPHTKIIKKKSRGAVQTFKGLRPLSELDYFAPAKKEKKPNTSIVSLENGTSEMREEAIALQQRCGSDKAFHPGVPS